MDLAVRLLSNDAEATARASAQPLTLSLQQAESVRAWTDRICDAWSLAPAEIRLSIDDGRTRLSVEEIGLNDARMGAAHELLVEQKNADGSWPDEQSDPSTAGTMDLFDGIGDGDGDCGGERGYADSGGGTGGVGGNVGGGESGESGLEQRDSGAADDGDDAIGVSRSVSPDLVAHSTSTTTEAATSAQGLVTGTSTPYTRGVVGLSNLGNTCFMNSMLQCLSSIDMLRTYFTEGRYEVDLNRDNPLGTRGELAVAFAELMRQMWSGQSPTVSPRLFKTTLGSCAPQFAGYAQHDAQEVCNYVVDKLHEDVNRVRSKPYVPNFEADGEPDEHIAREVLSRHRKRNDSHVSDLFEGLFKSTVVCPECDKVSVTFDPYMSVAVPLCASDTKSVGATLRRADGSLTPLSITLNRLANVGALTAAIAAQSALPASKLVVVELFTHKVQKVFSPDADTSAIYDGDFIVAYEVECAARWTRGLPTASKWSVQKAGGASAEADDEDDDATATPILAVVVLQRVASAHTNRNIGLPLLLDVEQNISGADLHARLRRELSCYEIAPSSFQMQTSTSDLPNVASTGTGALSREAANAEESGIGGDVGADSSLLPSSTAIGTSMGDASGCQGEGSSGGGGSGGVSGGGGVDGASDMELPTGADSSSVTATGGGALSDKAESEASAGSAMATDAPDAAAAERAEGGEGVPQQEEAFAPWKLYYSSSSYISSHSDESRIRDDGEMAFRKRAEGLAMHYVILEWNLAALEPGSSASRRYSRSAIEEAAEAVESTPFVPRSAARAAPPLSLGECLDLFSKDEELDADNAWYCPRCKEHRKVRKRIQLWSLPTVLTVHLKRFSTQGISRRKLDTMVSFPVDGLDMRAHCLAWRDSGEADCLYDLHAVSNHYGSTSSGHYTAYSKHSGTGVWYSCNDSQTSQVDAADVVTSSAYMLFYIRRGAAPPPASALPHMPAAHTALREGASPQLARVDGSDRADGAGVEIQTDEARVREDEGDALMEEGGEAEQTATITAVQTATETATEAAEETETAAETAAETHVIDDAPCAGAALPLPADSPMHAESLMDASPLISASPMDASPIDFSRGRGHVVAADEDTSMRADDSAPVADASERTEDLWGVSSQEGTAAP